jgi:hypothetical protein
MEFVARSRKPTKSHPFEAMVSLEVSETHLNPLPLVTRFDECFCLHLLPRNVTSIFVDISRDLSRRHVGATLQLEHADVAVKLGSGGYLTSAQQKQLNQEENANSRMIYDEKHPQ